MAQYVGVLAGDAVGGQHGVGAAGHDGLQDLTGPVQGGVDVHPHAVVHGHNDGVRCPENLTQSCS